MRFNLVIRALGIGLVALAISACATRESGYRITNETVAFIQPGTTTRSEVIENLGPPLLDLPDLRVSAYSWGKARAVVGGSVTPDQRLAGRQAGYNTPPSAIEDGGLVESQRWVYAIAWDEAGHVRRAQKIELERAGSLERAVREWATAAP